MSYHRYSLGQDLDPMSASAPPDLQLVSVDQTPLPNSVAMNPAIEILEWQKNKKYMLLVAVAAIAVGVYLKTRRKR